MSHSYYLHFTQSHYTHQNAFVHIHRMRFDKTRERMRPGCGVVARTFDWQGRNGRQVQI